jgi:predicted O-methyltransferase YrrM
MRKHWSEVKGYLEPDEAYQLAKLAKDRLCLEIGSFYGRSSVCMGEMAKEVVCVDTFEADESGQTQTGKITTLPDFIVNIEGYDNIRYIVARSQDFFRTLDGLVLFDLIFIDGFHEFSVVRYDIDQAWRNLRTGGILVLHDFGIGCGVPSAADDCGILPMDGQVIGLAWKVKQ